MESDYKGRYELRVDVYDINWKEQTVTRYHGSIKDQMISLMHGLKNMESDRAIRIYVYDTEEGKVVKSHEY